MEEIKKEFCTTNGEIREMKYCKCSIPQKNGGDNYCRNCDGLIKSLIEDNQQGLKTVLFEALGEVSMCWSKIPTGVFDSTNAERIGNELWDKIEQKLIEARIEERNKTLDELAEKFPLSAEYIKKLKK